jgi:hypothetical protein
MILKNESKRELLEFWKFSQAQYEEFVDTMNSIFKECNGVFPGRSENDLVLN